MNMIKRVTAAVIAAMMISIGVSAQMPSVWINVSSWAYNDVSAFINEGLLPDDMSSVSDYRESATRGQFAHLVFSMLEKAQITNEYEGSSFFDDGDYASEALASLGIVSGINERTFAPNDNITREDAAVIIYGAAKISIKDILSQDAYAQNAFADNDKISAYAKDAVNVLSSCKIISGDDESRFNPQSNITIEQAAVLLYKVYKRLPYTSRADGSNVSDSDAEVVVQVFSNGYYETKKGDNLYITDGTSIYLELETDMYSGAVCYANKSGVYVMARRYTNQTDVYDINTEEWKYSIPYPVINCSESYIFTAAADNTPQFGVYTYDGNEVLPPQYTISQLREMGYYDIYIKTSSDMFSLTNEKLITNVLYNNSTNLGRTTFTGTWDTIALTEGDGKPKASSAGISAYGENCVASLTDTGKDTVFSMTWLGLSDEALNEITKYSNGSSLSADDKKACQALTKSSGNYTNVYTIQLTDTLRRYGSGYGIEGRFSILKNGSPITKDAHGYIYALPYADSSGENTYLALSFDENGTSHELGVSLCFKDKSDEDIRIENERQSALWERLYSDGAQSVSLGDFTKAYINGTEMSLSEINRSSDKSITQIHGNINYNIKNNIAEMSLSCGKYDIDLYRTDNMLVTDDGIYGDFYITDRTQISLAPTTDVFTGTIIGFKGNGYDTVTVKSDDGRYLFEIKIAY